MSDRGAGKFELWPANEGVAWVYFRSGSGARSSLDLGALRTLDELLAEVEQRARVGEIRALIVASGTPDSSMIGYEPSELSQLDAEGVAVWSHTAQGALSRLELLPIPTVAAILGNWAGAGAELALSCRYRVAASDGGSGIAFPQVGNGFIPAWGGTARLSRMVGVPVAARLILTGKSLDAAAARDLRLVDRTFPVGDFEDSAERFAIRLTALGKQTSTSRRGRRPIHQRFLDESGPGRRLLAQRISQRYWSVTRTNVAAKMALELLLDAASVPIERALAMESAAASRLATEPTTRAALHAQRALDGVRGRRSGDARPISAAIIGAGQTGSDLAHLLITAGIQVRLKDRPETVRSGLSQARLRLRWELDQGRISRAQARRRAGRLNGVTGFGGFGTLDLLIAAPDAGDGSPAALLQSGEPHVLPDCVLAFHHWTLSPSIVQRELRYPDRVLGLVCHFPADTFPLAEVTRGAATSAETVERTLGILADAGLTPVLLSDRTPTPGLRLLGIYFAEACRLLAEGATPFQVDEAMETFGFAVGPFHRLDAIGSVRAQHMLLYLSDSLGERFRTTALLDRIARGAETFYRYRNGVPVAANPSLPSGLSPGGPSVTGMIQRRIILLLINEAARILDSDPDLDPARLDAISLLGLGFPTQKGGIVYHAESLDPAALVVDLNRVAMRAGPRYAPADRLREAVSSGRGSLQRGSEEGGDRKENERPEAGHQRSGALT